MIRPFFVTVVLSALVMFWGSHAAAQTPIRVDLEEQIHLLPDCAQSAADAHNRSTCRSEEDCTAGAAYTSYDGHLEELQQQIKNINSSQQSDVDNQNREAAQIENDHVASMDDAQKLQYAQQHSIGPDSGTMSFAQRMNDPSFRAQFLSLSPEQRMAAMKNGGMFAKDNSGLSQNTGVADAHDDLLNKIKNDPQFAQQFQNMSDSERTAYMKQSMEQHGTNFEAIARQTGTASSEDEGIPTRTGGPLAQSEKLFSADEFSADEPAANNGHTSSAASTGGTPSGAASATARKLQAEAAQIAGSAMEKKDDIDKFIARASKEYENVVQHYQPLLQQHSEDASWKGLKMSELQDEEAVLNRTYRSFDSILTAEKTRLRTLVTSFNADLSAAQYGASLTSAEDQKLLAGIANGELVCLAYLQFLNKHSISLVETGAAVVETRRSLN